MPAYPLPPGQSAPDVGMFDVAGAFPSGPAQLLPLIAALMARLPKQLPNVVKQAAVPALEAGDEAGRRAMLFGGLSAHSPSTGMVRPADRAAMNPDSIAQMVQNIMARAKVPFTDAGKTTRAITRKAVK